MQRFLPTQYHNVLEIGCGEGNFRDSLSQHCEYWGIEPSQDAANVAAQKIYKVLNGTYEEVFNQLPDSYFDLIICNDVIEHMVDHDAFFLTVKNKMKKNSFIIGSIPNVRYLHTLIELLIKKDWIYRDAGILDRTHLRFFTEKSLKRTFTDHEFIIEEFCGINQATFKKRSIKNFIKKLLIYIIGRDSRYLQFGFRIKYR